MRHFWILVALVAGVNTQAMAEACIVHSQSDRLDIKVCQENRTIPPKMFHDGFCQPQLAGQKTDVAFVEHCPAGAFGVCSNAQIANMPYRQDIHYYGIASDAQYLQPFCQTQSNGDWLKP